MTRVGTALLGAAASEVAVALGLALALGAAALLGVDAAADGLVTRANEEAEGEGLPATAALAAIEDDWKKAARDRDLSEERGLGMLCTHQKAEERQVVSEHYKQTRDQRKGKGYKRHTYY